MPLASRRFLLSLYRGAPRWTHKPLQVHYEYIREIGSIRLDRFAIWRYKAFYRRRRERVGSQVLARASRGRWEPGAGRDPNILPEPPAESGRRGTKSRPRRLVGPAGRARYSECVPGEWDATERTGPRGSGQVGWYREGFEAPVPTVERRFARGAGAFV